MSITERVEKLRAQQKKAESKTSHVVAKKTEELRRAQDQVRAHNLAYFNEFVQQMGLRENLSELIEKEGLVGAEIEELPQGAVASKVELRLKWQGKPKRVYQENAIPTRLGGFLSISITRYADGNIVVEGEEEVDRFHESSLGEETIKVSFEDAIGQAYLKPRWNEEHYQIMQASEEPNLEGLPERG